MKLLVSPPSPYSAKVRMGAVVAGLKCEDVITDTINPSAEFLERNPLGKIPTLLTDDGMTVFDSRAIMQYFDRAGKTRLFPRNAAKRTEIEVLEAICDGICDALLLIVYEKRFRPEEMHYQPWIDRQWDKATRALDELENRIPRMGKTPNAAHIAIAALTSYLNLRFEGKWERGRPKLKAFSKKFDANFPELTPLRPKA